MEVTLLGTGDTTGTPTVGCSCATCERARELGVERSRFSVHIHNPSEDASLLIDASPDFRYQFLQNDIEVPDEAIVTHIHFDHINGLGNCYRVCKRLPVYASGENLTRDGPSVAETVETKFEYLDPLDVRRIEPYEPLEVCGMTVRLLPVEHPPVDCYGLRIEDPESGGVLGITGDTNYDIPPESREFLTGVDLLLAEAIVPASFCEGHPAGGRHQDETGTPRSFGTKHLTREGALAVADDVGASEVRLVHASHFYPPDEAFEDPIAVDGERYVI